MAANPMTLTELIAALEAATEGSPQLDGEIWRIKIGKPHDVWAYDDDGVLLLQDPEDTISYGYAPKFTTSLDAALTLVPEGWAFNLLDLGRDLGIPPQCEYARPRDPGSDVVSGATPALALCVAALKAVRI